MWKTRLTLGGAWIQKGIAEDDKETIRKLLKEYLEKEVSDGQYTKELWIDRRENSKSLAWSSVLLALGNIKKVEEVVERPKALGDIRGVTYIYGMFYRFGLINVPDEAKEKMKKAFGKSL